MSVLVRARSTSLFYHFRVEFSTLERKKRPLNHFHILPSASSQEGAVILRDTAGLVVLGWNEAETQGNDKIPLITMQSVFHEEPCGGGMEKPRSQITNNH